MGKRGSPRVRDYKAEYAKRIERAKAKGKTRQEARGHKPGEAKRRKEREREELGLSSSEIRTIRQWCERYSNKDRDTEGVIDFARKQGYSAFQLYRSVWNAARKTYVNDLKNGTYSSQGEPYLSMLTDMAGVPELSWLYYH